MELERTRSQQLGEWTRKHSKPLAVGLTTIGGLMYLWDRGYTFLTTTCSIIALGTAYLYSCGKARREVTLKDVVVITGCDSGLGYSLALHCHSLGATVIAGVLQENELGARELSAKGIAAFPLDITNRESVRNFGSIVYAIVKQRNLTMRALVNNAGVMIFGEFEWQTEEQVRQQVEVNLLGTMRVTRELMPLIRAHLSRIIVISSHCASEPLPGIAAYGATKAAVSAWATALRVETAKYGIDVVCFVPGSFTRESNLLARQDKHFEDMSAAMTEEAKSFYGHYFKRYNRYLSSLARDVRPQKLENPSIYEAFNGALLDRFPWDVYKCEPWRYTFYHILFKVSPTPLRDRFVERFMQMPTWREDDRITEVALKSSSVASDKLIGKPR